MKPTARKPKQVKEKSPKIKLTNTERSRIHRMEIYGDQTKHMAKKEYDKMRKRRKREEEKSNRKNNIRMKINYRMTETLRKRIYRMRTEKEKNGMEASEDEIQLHGVKKAVNAARRLRRRKDAEISTLKVKISGLCPQHNSTMVEEEIEEDEQSTVDFIWQTLTPRTKDKVKHRVSKPDVPKVVKRSFRQELGVNLSNKYQKHSETKSKLCVEIEQFFERDDVSRMCPDKKKTVVDPEDGQRKQVRWRLGYLKSLYFKFIAETDHDCCYETFTRYVPCNIKKPSASDWGTCLCIHCLNPELKLERLYQLKMLGTAPDMESIFKDDESFNSLINQLNNLDEDVNISFTEWRKVNNETQTKTKSKQKNKISRKVLIVLSAERFKRKLITELNNLKDHLHRVHTQYRAFKKAREEASESSDTVTIQIDWSENSRIRQCKEEKAAYYHEDQVSLHTAYSWFGKKQQSYVCLSDCTDHKAPAVFASMQPILETFIQDGSQKFNIISDSPTSQYRNKTIFYFICEFTKTTKVPVKWIYLEAGHGKGVPDGVGAVVKRAISDLIPFNPDVPQYTCDDLINLGLKEAIPSIIVSQYSIEDIAIMNSKVPKLKSVHGTMKCHEVFSEVISKGTDREEVVMSMKPLSSEPATRFQFTKEPGTVPNKDCIFSYLQFEFVQN